MLRWLAKEVVRRDASLAGFWPLLTNFLDYSGRGNHVYVDDGFSDPGSLEPTLASLSGRAAAIFYPQENYWLTARSRDTSFNPLKPFSVGCWFLSDNVGDSSCYIMSQASAVAFGSSSPFYGWGLGFLSSGSSNSLFFAIYGNSSQRIQVRTPTTIHEKRWTHLFVTYNGNGHASGIRMYVDGRPYTSAFAYYDVALIDNIPVVDPVRIGAASFRTGLTAANYFHGAIQLARLYAREVAPKEIASFYQRELSLFAKPRRGLSRVGGNLIASLAVSLYIGAVLQGSDQSAPLYIADIGTVTGSGTLYVNGSFALNSQATLYIGGGNVANQGMNLFMQGPATSPSSVSATLYSAGSTNPGAAGFATMHINGTAFGAGMNMFLRAADTITKTGNMNMYVGGALPTAAGSAPMVLANTTLAQTGQAAMYVRGDGTTAGSTPFGTGMLLFIQRPLAQVATMFISAGTPATASVPLTVQGALNQSASAPLSMPVTKAVQSGQVKLYTHGW